MGLYLLLARSRLRAAYTSRLLQALIKIYSLVDCPIYSVVKYRPHQLALIAPPQRVLDCCQSKVRRQPSR